MPTERSINEMNICEAVLNQLKLVLPINWNKICLRVDVIRTDTNAVSSTVDYWLTKGIIDKNMVHYTATATADTTLEDIKAVCSLIGDYLAEQSAYSCIYTFFFTPDGKGEIKYTYHDNNEVKILE